MEIRDRIRVMETPKKKGPGGWRPGAGRKFRNYVAESTVTVTPEIAAELRELGGGNFSEGVRMALSRYKELVGLCRRGLEANELFYADTLALLTEWGEWDEADSTKPAQTS